VKYVFIFLFILISVLGFAQEKIEIQRINQEIKIDGIIDEPIWEQISPLLFIQHTPIYGNKPTEHTEARLAYDDNYLYISGKLYDKHKVQSNALERDGGNASSDWFGVAIDSYNDKENAMAFFTTPSGLRWDATVLEGGVGNISLNTNWNSYWDVATSISDQGWFAEFRIPLSSLRFQDINGETVMGLITWRLLARNNEWDIFPDISPEHGPSSFYKISRAQEIVFQNIESKKPVYITPYLLGGIGQNFEHNQDKTKLISNNEYKKEAGLDLKYSITSNLTLDATINTDFAQVEADNQEINLSRFSLFFPEKRKFFQERSSNFELNFSDFNKVFYSRRIGIHNSEQVRIYGGARLVGRTNGWDIGFLNMQTEKTSDLPTENLGVLRLRRQVFNPYSNVGIIATTRLGNNGNYNVVYGADGTIKVFAEDYFIFAIAQSMENDASNKPLSLNPTRVYLNWERRILDGFSYLFEGSHVGENYNPGLGFESRKNYKSLNVKLKYSWFPNAESKIFQHQTSVRSLLIYNNTNGELESAQYGPEYYFSSKSGYSVQIFPRINYENIHDTIFIDDNTNIPNKKYNFYDLYLTISTPSSSPFKISSRFEYGTFYDGNKLTSSVTARWSMSKHFEFESTYQYNDVRFSSRDQHFTNHIGRLRALIMYSTKLSLSSFAQYNSANDAIFSNVRFRYNPREGHDLYIVYNQSSLLDENLVEDINPNSKFWTIMLKYNYTFKF